ncbi:MAG: transglycosylase SLT domain-containing protein [Gammaproteobacteria bacterium]
MNSRALYCTGVFAVALLPAILASPSHAAPPFAACCSDELQSWEEHHPSFSVSLAGKHYYPNIWERLKGGFSLGAHLQRASVRTELDRFIQHLPSLYQMLEQSQPYLHYVVQEVERRNMPLEIALLPFIESQFKPHASSEYGAAGIWQFMPSTARHFKLEMNWWVDDRRDVIKSTQAALDYLEQLAQRFNGDWLLAVAAYNTGPRRVQEIRNDSLRRGQPQDFWTLNLPRQTRRYVPALVALATIVRWGEINGQPLPEIPNHRYFKQIHLPQQVDLLSLIKLVDIPVDEFFALNAGFKQWAPKPSQPVNILLPLEDATKFAEAAHANQHPTSIKWTSYLVRDGDSLSEIAALFGTSINHLRQLNGLILTPETELEAGRYLLIPTEPTDYLHPRGGNAITTTTAQDSVESLALNIGIEPELLRQHLSISEQSPLPIGTTVRIAVGPEIPETAVGKRSAFYHVRSGDTLSSIANRFDTSVSELMRLNEKSTAALYPGSKILIPLRSTP